MNDADGGPDGPGDDRDSDGDGDSTDRGGEGGGHYQVIDLETGEVVGETETRPPLLDAESQELVAGVLHSIVEELGEDELPDWERAAYERALDELVYEDAAGSEEGRT